MKKQVWIFTVLISVIIVFISGCQKGSDERTGRIIIKITDSPFPIDFIEDASVTVTKVEMRHVEDEVGSEEEEEGEENGSNRFLTLFEGSESFNLLELRNGMMAAFIDLEIPVGDYDLIRIYVEDASISVIENGTYSVKVPSGSQTGVKVFIKPSLTIAGGLTSELILDFSLDKSFVLKGNMSTPAGIKGFNFKPVIRAVNSSTAGTVRGVVKDTEDVPLQGVTVSIMQGEFITTAYTDEAGFYALPGIPAGIYSIAAEAEGYVNVTVENLEIVAGNAIIQDFVLEAETTVK